MERIKIFRILTYLATLSCAIILSTQTGTIVGAIAVTIFVGFIAWLFVSSYLTTGDVNIQQGPGIVSLIFNVGIPLLIIERITFYVSQDKGNYIVCLYQWISVGITLILSFITRQMFIKTEEYKIACEKAKKSEEERKEKLEIKRQKDIEKFKEINEKKKQKEMEKEEKICQAWLDYNDNLINRGMHCYSVAFTPHKKYMSGIIVPRFYVEAINKESAVSEARKKLPNEAKHQTVTECVAIAGMKNLSYGEIVSKWKDRYLGNKELA